MSVSELSILDLQAIGPETSGNILQGILDAVRESVIIVDSSMRVTASNKAARSAFARDTGALEMRRLSEVIRDAELHSAFQSAIESAELSEFRLEFVGSERRTYDVRVAPIDLKDSRSAVGVFYDVTQIERLERVRQEFLSNVSHELRTPLTSIMAFVETLEDGAIEDKDNNRRFLGVIRRNAERMHALISDILELSMIESGTVSLNPQRVKLFGVVDEVFASLAAKAAAREVTLVNTVSSDVTVWSDQFRLEQMLTNLIDNAIKFNRHAGSVTVEFRTESGNNLISVADTGEGVLTEHLQRIFERFYRADRGRTREVGGTGLGLAIVKHLARLHGGEVSATSALGRGTTFLIELPVK